MYFFGRRELLGTLEITKFRPAPEAAPERLEAGTQNHEGIVGAAATVDFLAGLISNDEGTGKSEPADSGVLSRRQRLAFVFDSLHDRGCTLLERLWMSLRDVADIHLYGPPPPAQRTPTLALSVQGVPAIEVARKLARRGIFASHGNFYAQTLVKRLGLTNDGLVRLGCACYTTEGEVDRAIECLRSIARGQG
ncbi:MAG: aminotransferase class V-fold PLP-dependent enzyme [Isosphaeraceae bacterium]